MIWMIDGDCKMIERDDKYSVGISIIDNEHNKPKLADCEELLPGIQIAFECRNR